MLDVLSVESIGESIASECNDDATTATFACVSNMRTGETMQINRDGNFLIPQVDGPADLLLSGDDEQDDKLI